MKAMVLDGFGGPEVLYLSEIERPVALPGTVIVQVAYAGVNPADWKAREGWLARYFQYQFPFVVGFDAAGIVVDVGKGVEGLSVGDRVVTPGNQGLGERGSYAEFLRAAAERTIRIPDHVSFAKAATLPTAGMTAWEATLDNGKAHMGSCVVINGGAGGCGSFAIQLARMAGARVIATCSAANFDYVRSLGSDVVIDYRSENVTAAIMHHAPGGVDLVVDTVGQGTLIDVVAAMKKCGRICPIGTLIANEPQVDPGAAKAAQVLVIPTISSFANQPRQLQSLVDALGSGEIIPPAMSILPLHAASEAHRRIQNGHVRGKILLDVNGQLEAANIG